MGILESLRMLKVDFLGLATLSVMARACDLIETRHEIKYDLSNIPLNDPKAFELVLICSDGLHSMISDEAIREVLVARGASLEDAGALIDPANEAGGRDNVSVVLLRYTA